MIKLSSSSFRKKTYCIPSFEIREPTAVTKYICAVVGEESHVLPMKSFEYSYSLKIQACLCDFKEKSEVKMEYLLTSPWTLRVRELHFHSLLALFPFSFPPLHLISSLPPPPSSPQSDGSYE